MFKLNISTTPLKEAARVRVHRSSSLRAVAAPYEEQVHPEGATNMPLELHRGTPTQRGQEVCWVEDNGTVILKQDHSLAVPDVIRIEDFELVPATLDAIRNPAPEVCYGYQMAFALLDLLWPTCAELAAGRKCPSIPEGWRTSGDASGASYGLVFPGTQLLTKLFNPFQQFDRSFAAVPMLRYVYHMADPGGWGVYAQQTEGRNAEVWTRSPDTFRFLRLREVRR